MVSFATVALLASGLMASASAANHRHGHANLHKRGDAPPPKQYGYEMPEAPKDAPPAPNATQCGCTTYTTYWYGDATHIPYAPPPPEAPAAPKATTTTTTTSVPPPAAYTPPVVAAPKPAEKPAAPKPKEEAKPAPAPAKEEKPAPPPTYGPPAPKPQPAKEAPKPSGYGSSGGSGIKANGNQWAMAYTPYRQDGNCKSADEVAHDVQSIKAKGFTSIRLYATDCSGPQNVGNAAKANGMKILLGVYIDAKGLGPAREQVGQLTQWGSGNWEMVEMVVVGNEAVFNGFCSASDLASFIVEVKTAFKSAGYNGPVTTTETLNILQENGSLFCGVVDVIAANIHPFFNGMISAEEAGDFAAKQMSDLSAVCNGQKEAYNLETGWPSSGKPNNRAVPGEMEQKTAIDSIISKIGSKSVVFSFEDDSWKSPGEYAIEQFWGCAKLFES